MAYRSTVTSWWCPWWPSRQAKGTPSQQENGHGRRSWMTIDLTCLIPDLPPYGEAKSTKIQE